MSRRRPPSASNVTTLDPPRGARGTRSTRAGSQRTDPGPSERDERPPRRRRYRVARALLAVAVVVATLGVASRWVLHLEYFSVQHVSIVGVHHEPVAQVLAASGLEAHPAMVDVSSSSVRQRLERFAWISGVTVVKHWPNTVEVQIKENTAVAVAFDAQHSLQYVDARGADLGPAPLNANLPTLEYASGVARGWPFEHAGAAAAFVASQLPVAFSSQVATIAVDRSGSVTLHLTTPVSFVLGPVTQLRAKFVAIASVIAHSTLRPGDVVDVTVPSELAVTGAPPS